MSQPMDTLTICCCGRQQCAYLQHNNVALEGLEKDLKNAAQIGQVRFLITIRPSFLPFIPLTSLLLHARHVTNIYTPGAACAP